MQIKSMLALFLLVVGGSGQQSETMRHGRVERIQVHGQALEGNLEGDSPDRKVAVYLPPSYQSATNRRYSVVYLLHGFTDEVDKWWGVKPHFINVPVVADRAFNTGVSEMILVMPDAFTRYQGSMYSNSVTTGNWEEYITKELVAYIDSHYRTIPDAAGRGLAGHSMGGYGTLRLGMKYPGIFSSLYLLSPCCLAVGTVHPNTKAEAIQDPAEVAKADFFTKAVFASAAAWSPNPKKPPLFLDLPYQGGEVQPQIVAKWEANAPLAMIDQYISSLRQYTALAMDVGDRDQPIAGTVATLDQVLQNYAIRHEYEVYQGDHINRIAERLEKKVLPFFAAHLKKPS